VADQTSGQPAGWPAQYPPLRPQVRVQTGFNPSLRAATADRERTVDVLKAGFAEGRLTQDEYNDRMARAYEARTYGELARLTADLPAGPMPPMPQFPVAVPSRKTNSMAVAAILLGLGTPFFGLTAIPAIIAGHRARHEIRRTGEAGDGMAVAGLVLGYLAVIVGTLLLLGFLAFGHRSGTSFPHGQFPPGQ
jgi:DUF1707 SHOCT-like domain/Domain of unknown function (DUF4190)